MIPYEGTIIRNTMQPQMVFQDPYGSLNPSKRIAWILEEPLRLKGGLSKEERVLKVKTMLERVGPVSYTHLDVYKRQVMDKLKNLEAVAYVRFASVYREFKDINTFMDELKKVLK